MIGIEYTTLGFVFLEMYSLCNSNLNLFYKFGLSYCISKVVANRTTNGSAGKDYRKQQKHQVYNNKRTEICCKRICLLRIDVVIT